MPCLAWLFHETSTDRLRLIAPVPKSSSYRRARGFDSRSRVRSLADRRPNKQPQRRGFLHPSQPGSLRLSTIAASDVGSTAHLAPALYLVVHGLNFAARVKGSALGWDAGLSLTCRLCFLLHCIQGPAAKMPPPKLLLEILIVLQVRP